METKTPTIKGMFVNSHVNVLLKQKGKQGILELQKRYGKPVKFRTFQDVPVKEEIKILELVLEILTDGKISPNQLSFEAGKLHFNNFSATSYGKIITSQFQKKFKKTMLNCSYIAGQVFKGVKFTSYDLGPKVLKIVMENNDYPLDHFKGFFSKLMEYAGLIGTIQAKITAPGKYEYLAIWE